MEDTPRSVWDDRDVADVFDFSQGQPNLRMSLLNPLDQMLLANFVEVDSRAQMNAPADAFVRACLSGVDLFDDGISDGAPIGFRKFIAFQVALNLSIMWDLFRNARESAAIADWVVHTFSTNGWDPDGIPGSPMGQRCRWSMAIAAESGGGLKTNPASGQMEWPNGEVARQAAKVGSF